MKVVYFSKYSDQGPSSRFRVFQFAGCFQEVGVDLRIQPLFNGPYFDFLRTPASISRNIKKSIYVAGRFRERRRALKQSHADLFVIEHQLFPYLPFSVEKKLLPARYLLEFDDAIYLTHPKKFPELIRKAAGVIVGNKVLAKYATNYHEKVHIVPTVLNTDHFLPAEKPQSDRITIGWSGLEYNFPYLYKVSTVLERLLQKYPLEIVILSGSAPKDLPFPFRFEKWDRYREEIQISEFDIGLMPLEMDEWCRAKCGMKLLQYMSEKIPSVVTPIGVNREIIHHGENGFWAESLDQWEQRISELIEDRTLRQRMGNAARTTVVQEYSLHHWFPRLLEIYTNYAN